MTNTKKTNNKTLPICKSGLTVIKSIFISLVMAGLAIGGVFSLPVSVSAQVITIPANPPADAYNKSWFVKTINLGETITDTVLVQNLSQKDAEIEVVARDTVQDGGGFSLKDKSKPSTGIGS